MLLLWKHALLFSHIFLLILTTELVALGIVFLVRRRPNWPAVNDDTGEIESAYVTAISSMYAVLLGFIVLVTWTRYSAAEDTVNQEANTVLTVYQLAGGLPPPQRAELRQSCRDYVTSVIHDEWPQMAKGQTSPRTVHVLTTMWGQMAEISTHGPTDAVLREQLLTAFVSLTSLHRQRLFTARPGLPKLLWRTLVIGAWLAILFCAIFGAGRLFSHMMEVSVMLVFIVLVLFTIYSFDNPFASDLAIKPESFLLTQTAFQMEQTLQ